MGSASLFSQLDMGKRSLTSSQSGINVAGHNIANINNEDYSRQRVDLESQHPKRSRFGAGVDINGVKRQTDVFLNRRLISEQARGGSLSVRADTLRRLENLFNDTEGLGLRQPLNDFWDAWGKLANQPESEIFRKDVLTNAKTLSNRFQGVAADMTNIREELNGRVAMQVSKINQLAAQLAKQNTLIQQTERGSGETNDLRDQREGTLKELSSLVQVDWFEDDEHLVNVSVGNGWPLVLGRRNNLLEASYRSDEVGFFSLRGVDSKGMTRELTDLVKGGELRELLDLRDETVPSFMKRVDELASEMSFNVNRVHASGTGLNSTFDRVTSSFALRGDAVERPLPFIKDGSFTIHMVDDDNDLTEEYSFQVYAGQDNIRDVVNRINTQLGPERELDAKLNSDGSVTLASLGPHRFILGRDDANFAVVMGFNNFFENLEGAKDIRVNERLLRNPQQISTGKNLIPGDNTVALSVHQLQFEPTMRGGSVTFDEFYNGITSELGLTINSSNTDLRNQELVIDQFKKLRDEVSSVNMDEEVADMVQYQRGFDAAAKFISTVDDMTRTVINM